jgi:hypothetical protein
MFEDQKASSIRLENLNSDVARKLRKFDVTNDGSIDMNEAIQALITLQKQSDNYKKMIWILVPVLVALVASVFGTTILAIRLTQELKVTNGNLLTTMDGSIAEVVSTSFNITGENLTSLVFTPDIVAISDISIREGYSAQVTGVSQNLFVNPHEAYITTQFFTLTIYSNSSTMLTPLPGYETHPMVTTYTAPMIKLTFMGTTFTATGKHESKPTTNPSPPPPGAILKPKGCTTGCVGTTGKGPKIFP